MPLVFSDGSVYGTFCGFSHRILDYVEERDLETVGLLAGLVAEHVEEADRQR